MMSLTERNIRSRLLFEVEIIRRVKCRSVAIRRTEKQHHAITGLNFLATDNPGLRTDSHPPLNHALKTNDFGHGRLCIARIVAYRLTKPRVLNQRTDQKADQ